MREQDRQVRPLTSTRQEGRAANPVTSIGLHVSPELEIYIETRDAREKAESGQAAQEKPALPYERNQVGERPW